MQRDFQRTDRLSKLFLREIALLLQLEIRDPRLSMITVSDVHITKDLSYAKVFVTFLKEDADVTLNLKLLNQAAGFFRTELSKRIKLRKIPELTFVYDKSLLDGLRLSSLIDKAVEASSQSLPDDKRD